MRKATEKLLKVGNILEILCKHSGVFIGVVFAVEQNRLGMVSKDGCLRYFPLGPIPFDEWYSVKKLKA